jgi:hypothetical protein
MVKQKDIELQEGQGSEYDTDSLAHSDTRPIMNSSGSAQQSETVTKKTHVAVVVAIVLLCVLPLLVAVVVLAVEDEGGDGSVEDGECVSV